MACERQVKVLCRGRCFVARTDVSRPTRVVKVELGDGCVDNRYRFGSKDHDWVMMYSYELSDWQDVVYKE